ncbi:MAG TPA: sensor histidine kinase [Cyclobacteriaceae bacterium]
MTKASKEKFITSDPKIKWIILIISLLIAGGSIFYTSLIVNKIKVREENQIALYASTLEYLANNPNPPNFLFENVIISNKTIPVIRTDELGMPVDFKNIPAAERASNESDKLAILYKELSKMARQHEPVAIELKNDQNKVYGYSYVYYKDSFLLTQLWFFPYLQLTVIIVFAFAVYMIFNYSRNAEQNRVWAGLAKETAHQLGTPLSSLMAWMEYLKSSSNLNEEVVGELEKDVKRLEVITSRFSNIGSVPHLTNKNVFDTVTHAVRYLQNRISKKVVFSYEVFPNEALFALINQPLFEWVIENLVKNAVDAMEGKGDIKIKIIKINGGKVAIDIGDTGRGISKSDQRKIFEPGYTSKKRGWGLGLTLARRIIEKYHSGKIFVKSSEVGKGTVFRIQLKSS